MLQQHCLILCKTVRKKMHRWDFLNWPFNVYHQCTLVKQASVTKTTAFLWQPPCCSHSCPPFARFVQLLVIIRGRYEKFTLYIISSLSLSTIFLSLVLSNAIEAGNWRQILQQRGQRHGERRPEAAHGRWVGKRCWISQTVARLQKCKFPNGQ